MFERFTNRARRVVVLAQEEARLLSHNYIGTEHILLGLIAEGQGVAAKALESLEVSLQEVRQQVEAIIGRGVKDPSGHIPFTPRAKKVLELSLREALQLGHNYIGTEHILLGLLREGEGVAAQVLVRLGCDLNTVRQRVISFSPPEEDEDDLPRYSPPRVVTRAEIADSLAAILDRLAAIEAHLGISRPQDAAAGAESAAVAPAAAGSAASGTAPSGTAPSGTAPSGTAPSGSAPSGSGESGTEAGPDEPEPEPGSARPEAAG
jgi:hypothetical protein